MKHLIRLTTICLAVLFMAGCAQLKKQAETIKPTAKVTDTRIAGINFEQVNLLFDIAIENKNPVALKLAGLDYDFKIDNNSLLSGETAKGIKIKARSTSKVSLPVTLKFSDLQKFAGESLKKDNLDYLISMAIKLDLPVIGKYSVPLEHKGEFPVPKLPKLSFKRIHLENLGLTSADVVAQIEVENPNAFSLGFSKFNYKLDINSTTWGSGRIDKPTQVSKKGRSTIDIPLKLNLLNMGSAMYKLLSSSKNLDYKLTGDMKLDTGLAMLKNYDLPLNLNGQVPLK